MKHIRSVLSDGEWHPLLWIVAEVGDSITPEACIRWLKTTQGVQIDPTKICDVIPYAKMRIVARYLELNAKAHKSRPQRLERREGKFCREYRLIRKDENENDTA